MPTLENLLVGLLQGTEIPSETVISARKDLRRPVVLPSTASRESLRPADSSTAVRMRVSLITNGEQTTSGRPTSGRPTCDLGPRPEPKLAENPGSVIVAGTFRDAKVG